MDIIKIVALVLTAASLSIVLRQYRAEYAMAITLLVTVMVFAAVIPAVQDALRMLYRVADQTGAAGPAVTIAKSLGIAFVAGIGADTCRDAGEEAMASRVELAGRICILAIALPMAAQLMGLFQQILS